jgi:hypothetical protein
MDEVSITLHTAAADGARVREVILELRGLRQRGGMTGERCTSIEANRSRLCTHRGAGTLGGTGCATIEHPAPIERCMRTASSETWRWQSDDVSARSQGVRDGQLRLYSDSTYRLTEIRHGAVEDRRGD